jgi:hypothetical protein
MADTRVLCVSADTVCDSMLSVADEVVARPVHDRARSVGTQRAARRVLLELSSGVVDVVMLIRVERRRTILSKKNRVSDVCSEHMTAHRVETAHRAA